MDDKTSQTQGPEDNLLNLTEQSAINEEEAKGISLAEFYILGLDAESPISASTILQIHKTAFGHLYEWAGKWRTINVMVGSLEPPEPFRITSLIYQFIDNLNYKISKAVEEEDIVECLLYAHYEFIRIHPFTNGNGRSGRIIMNLVALKLGYQPLVLYHREGDSRKVYIKAMQAADEGNLNLLTNLILQELKPI